MEKIDTENLQVGLVTVYEGKNIVSGYDGTAKSLKIIAEKVNEMIDVLKSLTETKE